MPPEENVSLKQLNEETVPTQICRSMFKFMRQYNINILILICVISLKLRAVVSIYTKYQDIFHNICPQVWQEICRKT